MKKTFIALSVLSLLSGCQKSLSDQAAKEAEEFTRKYCPTPKSSNERTDSMTFDRRTNTIIQWKTLFDAADNAEIIEQMRPELRNTILQYVTNTPATQVYRNAGFSFRYVYRSNKNPKQILLDYTFGPKDYNRTEGK